MGFRVVIPARYASVRLPGKPLRPIAGRPVIEHVITRARESAAERVVVATDDARIAAAAHAVAADVVMTGSHHRSGSDRIAEVLDRLGWSDDTLVVNLQGDEPCMPARLLDQVAEAMSRHRDAGMATLAHPIQDRATLFDPNVVKVVTNREGYALYFSRAPMPWHRDAFPAEAERLPEDIPFLRHIGLYAYRAGFLRRYVTWAPAPLERAESLEQLRALWFGGRIHVSLAAVEPGPGVDTPDDLAKVERLLGGTV